MLHLYVWPAALAVTAAAYVFGWMRWTEKAPAETASPASAAPATQRFVVLAVVFIILFAAASPLYLQSAWVLAVAGFIARAAGAVLRFCDVPAVAAGNLLVTARGGFAVTQECISTPLIPVYIAAVLAYATTWRQRAPALLAVVPIFVALGIARLLVVALPAALIASPLFFVHAFYQLLTAVVVVSAAACWRHGAMKGWRRAALAIAAGTVCLYALTPVVSRMFAAGPSFQDPQGALVLLPAFQIALFAALWTVVSAPAQWRALAIGLVVLVLSQAALFAGLHAVDGFVTLAAHVPEVRAWSITVPLALVAVMGMYDTPRV